MRNLDLSETIVTIQVGIGIEDMLMTVVYRKPKFTPVLFHNLSGYDSHLFSRT